MKLYDKKQIDWKNILFDNKTLFWLILPIVIEQFLNSLMGLADTMMVSTIGTSAIPAQAMTDILEPVNGIFSNSVGIGLMTVVGQCISARRTEEAKYYIVNLMCIAGIGVLMSCLFVLAITKPVTWLSGMEPAAAKFPMIVSVISMWCCRVALCVVLVRVFHFGLIAVWIGMFADWGVRAAIFTTRFLRGKWLRFPKKRCILS